MNFATVNLFDNFLELSSQDGDIDMLSSDHSPSAPELKLFDEGDFLRAWGGISSLQVQYSLSLSHRDSHFHTKIGELFDDFATI